MIIQVGDGHFHFVIKLQAVCKVLSDYQIREDFKDGKIIPVANPSTILSSIDVLSDLFFPPWNVLKSGAQKDLINSELHMHLLWRKSANTFEINSDTHELESFSYNAWHEAFQEIFVSPYWNNKPLPPVEVRLFLMCKRQ